MNLKNSVLTIVLCFSVCSLSIAQLNIHVAGGVDLSTVKLNGTPMLDPGYYIGYHIELNVNKKIAKRLYANLSSQFLIKGYSIENSSYSGVKRSHIEFTPELTIVPTKQFELGLGSYYGFQRGSYLNRSDNNWQNLNNLGFNDDNDFGLSFLVRKQFKNYTFYCRYKYGFSALFERNLISTDGEILGTVSENTRHLQIGFGYVFNNVFGSKEESSIETRQ